MRPGRIPRLRKRVVVPALGVAPYSASQIPLPRSLVLPKNRTTVFISYAREDRRHAERLYADLRLGSIDVWLDTRSLKPGQDWKREIRRAIRSSAYVVLLLSEYSVTKRGFVQAEVKEAIEESRSIPTGDVFILPVRLADVRPADDELLDLNWVDLFPSYEKGLARILETLQNVRIAPLEYGTSITRSPVEYAYYRSFEEYVRDFLEKLPLSSSLADPNYAIWLTCDSREQGVTVPDEIRKSHPDLLRLVLQHQFDSVEVRNGVFSVVLWFSGKPSRITLPLSSIREVVVPAAGVRLVRI